MHIELDAMGPKEEKKKYGNQMWKYGFGITLIQLIIFKVTRAI